MPTLEEFQLIKERNLSHEVLLQNLEYDPIAGIFTRKNCHISALNGKPAGYLDQSSGYVKICIKGTYYRAHRLAWYYTHKEWPLEDLDHRDRDRSNNAIENLRLATQMQNSLNVKRSKANTSGYTGIYWDSQAKRWQAEARGGGVRKHIGNFKTLEDAALARESYAKQAYGEFYCQLSNSLAPLSPSLG